MSLDNRLQIKIDDRDLLIAKGITILEAARQHGIAIPTLCDFPGLPAHGSCRMCIVEIQGRQTTPTSCTTPAEEGMVVFTHSPKVQALRAELIQLLLADHPSACLYCPEKGHCDDCMVTLRKAGMTTGCGSCPKDEQCQLQALAQQYGVAKPGYPIHYRMFPVNRHDPFFDRDDNLCILCGRCVRICEDQHFANSLAFTQRGTHALVGTAFQRTHLETSCTFCGSCVEVCPTGALSEKTRKWVGKPERETASICPLCSLGCQVNLLAKGGYILGSLPNRAVSENGLCVRGRFGITELVSHPARLKQPQRCAGSARQGISWEEAIANAADKLAACPPERFELRISAACTSEDLYVARQFVHKVMHGGHLRTSAQAHFGGALEQVSRLMRYSGTVEQIDSASAILCLGLEDAYAFTPLEVHLHRAKQRGAKIILLGASGLSWSSYADAWLQAGAGEVVDLLQQLVEGTRAAPADHQNVAQVAHLLQQGHTPMVILGPAILRHPQNQELLQSVELLLQNLNARVILVTDEINLAGAVRLGFCSDNAGPEPPDLDVLYLIGEAVPVSPPGAAYLLYQNLYPPAQYGAVDLLLPTTAFTEETGTYIDPAGQVKTLHPAVPAAGTALPSWMILARIAQRMGVPGFEYACVEDIWQAAQAEFPGFPNIPTASAEKMSGDLEQVSRTVSSAPISQDVPDEPAYMGFPLADWVGGLRSLYPLTERQEQR